MTQPRRPARVLLVVLLATGALTCRPPRTTVFDDFLELIQTGQICKEARAITYSCGNGACEPEVGESTTSCAADCAAPATPEPPHQDEAVIPYYRGVVDCGTHTVYYPRTIAEAQAAMQARAGRRVRVIGSRHTGSTALCTDATGIVINTKRLNAVEGVIDWGGAQVVVAQAGAHIWDILQLLASQGLALGYNVPGYGRLTIGGFLAVGGHGSSDGGATITQKVMALEKMDGDGVLSLYVPDTAVYAPADPSVRRATPDAWRALMGDLGALGMTTRVYLATRPQFRLESRILQVPADDVFAPGGMAAIADRCDYAFAVFYHSLGKMDVTCGREVDAPLTGERTRMELFAPPVSRVVKDVYPTIAEATTWNDNLAELVEGALGVFRQVHPWILWEKDGESHCGNVAVGEAHNMIEMVFDGLHQPVMAQRDWEVAIPESKIDAAMTYVRSVLVRERLFNPTIGVVIRLDRAHATSNLASSSAHPGWAPDERLYYIEFPNFYPKTQTPAQRDEYEQPYFEMITKLMRDYGAQPHFGKNREEVFRFAYDNGVTTAKIDALSAQVCAFDPQGVFRNTFLENAGVRWTCP